MNWKVWIKGPSEMNVGGAVAQGGNHKLGWTAVLISLVSGTSGMASFILPSYFKSALGFTGYQIGWLCGLYSLTALLATVPVGLRNDYTSPKVMISFSLIVAAGAALAMVQVNRFIFFLIVYVFYGLGLASFRLSIDALIFKVGGNKHPGARWGYVNAFRMASLGIGTYCVGFILTKLGVTGWLTLQAGILAAGLFIVPLLQPFKTSIPSLRDYLPDLRQPGVVGFLSWLFLFSLHWGAELTSYGLFLDENLGLSLWGMAWFMGSEFIVLALTCLWIGSRCDQQLDHRRLIVGGLLLSGFSQILMCIPELWFSLFWRCIHGVGDGVIVVVMYSGIARLFDVGRIGGHSAGVNLVMMIGTFIGSVTFGPIGDRFGYEIPLVVTGAVVVVLAFFIRHPRRRRFSSTSVSAAAPI